MEAAKHKNGNITEVLRKGDIVIVNAGDLAGERAMVVDPVAIADGLPNQRKVTLDMDGHTMHILPRQLNLAEIQTTPIKETATMPTEAPARPTPVPTITTAAVADLNDRNVSDPMDDALDQYRPDPKVVDYYVHRTVPGGYDDVEYMLALRDDRDEGEARPNVALVGPTQSGKTLLMEVLAVLAAERDGMPKPYPLFTLNGSSGISNYDLFGKTTAVIIDGQEVLVWMDGVVPLAVRTGSILYLDEWNAVPPSQAVALHSVLDDRRKFTNTHRAVPNGAGGWMPEVVHANSNLWIVATINPVGYKGTQAMAEATSNRFRWLEWGYNAKVEEEIIRAESVRDLAVFLRHENEMGTLKTPVGTSALLRLNIDIATYGVEAALWSFLSMFQTQGDKDKVNEIIERQEFVDRLGSEYPDGATSGLKRAGKK